MLAFTLTQAFIRGMSAQTVSLYPENDESS
jgi:hypothetical protein